MADLDPNAWYQLTESRVDFNSSFQAAGGSDDAVLIGAQCKTCQQRWQIQPASPNTFQVRNQIFGTNRQLSACYNEKEQDSSKTQPCMQPSSGDEAQQWRIEPWGDGTYKFINVANGSDYNMDCHKGNPLFMSSATAETPKQPAQHWMFSSIGAVNDKAYSTAVTGAASSSSSKAVSTTPSSTSTSQADQSLTSSSQSSPKTASATPTSSTEAVSANKNDKNSDSNSSSPLSSGAAAGVGVGVTILVIGALIALFIAWRQNRKRKQLVEQHKQQQQGYSPGLHSGGMPYQYQYQDNKYHRPVYEADGNTGYEMEVPAAPPAPPQELPAREVGVKSLGGGHK